MYLVTQYKRKEVQINVEDLLNSMYEDEDYIVKEQENRNTIYKDLSYTRTRTVRVRDNDPRVYRQLRNRGVGFTGINLAMSYWLANNPEPVDTMYHTFKIPKATGGYREINAPNDSLKEIQTTIAQHLRRMHPHMHDSAYAYIGNRDCRKAIERHQAAGSNWFLKLDITKFFNNCSIGFIKQQLNKLAIFKAATGVDMELHPLDTFLLYLEQIAMKAGELPQGSPLSPILTNLIMIPVDYAINKALCKLDTNKFTYTRYADDLLISSPTEFDPNKVSSLIQQVLTEEETPFILKTEKTRYGSKAGQNWNLGIMYNKDNNLTVGHKRKKRIKTMIHQWYRIPEERSYESATQILGELAYLKNIEPEYSFKLMNWCFNKGQPVKADIRQWLKDNR